MRAQHVVDEAWRAVSFCGVRGWRRGRHGISRRLGHRDAGRVALGDAVAVLFKPCGPLNRPLALNEHRRLNVEVFAQQPHHALADSALARKDERGIRLAPDHAAEITDIYLMLLHEVLQHG